MEQALLHLLLLVRVVLRLDGVGSSLLLRGEGGPHSCG